MPASLPACPLGRGLQSPPAQEQTQLSWFAEHTALGTHGDHPCFQLPNTSWESWDPESLSLRKKRPWAQRWLPSKSPSCQEGQGRAGEGMGDEMPPVDVTLMTVWARVRAHSPGSKQLWA